MRRVFILAGFVASMGLVACSSTATPPAPSRATGGADLNPESGTTRNATTRTTDRRPQSLATVYFDYDDARLREDARGGLRQNAEFLQSSPDVVVELQGHCDERGTEEYNFALGKRRAESAKQYLEDLGIAPTRMSTVSFGEERPAVPGRNEAAWARNRRVEFVSR